MASVYTPFSFYVRSPFKKDFCKKNTKCMIMILGLLDNSAQFPS